MTGQLQTSHNYIIYFIIMNNIQIFSNNSFGELWVIEKDGKRWLCSHSGAGEAAHAEWYRNRTEQVVWMAPPPWLSVQAKHLTNTRVGGERYLRDACLSHRNKSRHHRAHHDIRHSERAAVLHRWLPKRSLLVLMINRITDATDSTETRIIEKKE